MGELYESIREFLVAVDDENRVIGCVALHVFWEDLAELKCLAVAEEAQGQKVGQQLVDACWASARELELDSVFALTYAVGFSSAAVITRSTRRSCRTRSGTNVCAVRSFPTARKWR